MLEILYYFIAVSSILIFFLMKKKYKINLISLTGLAYIISIFVVILPGYTISTGIFFEKFGFSRGFDIEIYIIYLLFTILFPLSIIIGRVLGKKYFLTINFTNKNQKMFNRLFIGVFIFFIFIIFLIGPMKVPILNFITYQDLYQAYQLKFAMRTDNSFFLFNKTFKIILIINFLYVYYYYFIKSYDKNLKNTIIYYLAFLNLIFLLTIRLGRDDIVQFLFILFLAGYTLTQSKTVLIKLILLFVILIFSWIIFSGYTQTNTELLTNLINRFIAQTGFSYLQINSVKDEFLGLNGIDMPGLGKILGQNFVSPSKEAYNLFYHRENGYGTAGLAFAQMYFVFGMLGFLISSILTIIISFIDEVLQNNISHANNNKERAFLNALFFSFITLYFIQIISNTYSLFTFPYIFSISFYTLILIPLFIIKFRVKIKTKGRK